MITLHSNFHQRLQLKEGLFIIKLPRHIPYGPPLLITKLTLNDPANIGWDMHALCPPPKSARVGVLGVCDPSTRPTPLPTFRKKISTVSCDFLKKKSTEKKRNGDTTAQAASLLCYKKML